MNFPLLHAIPAVLNLIAAVVMLIMPGYFSTYIIGIGSDTHISDADIAITYISAFYLLTSSIAHIGMAWWYYEEAPESNDYIGPQYVRWFEYMITFMLVSVQVAFVCGVRELSALICIGVFKACEMGLGLASELPVMQMPRAMAAFSIAMFVLILVSDAILIIAFVQTVSHPAFVTITLVLFLFYELFLMNIAAIFVNVQHPVMMESREKVHVWLDLIAKQLISWVIFAGTRA